MYINSITAQLLQSNTPQTEFDRNAAEQQLRLFGFDQPGSIFEVYVPLDNKRKFCGYFNDIDAAIEEIARYDGTANVYVTLNPVRPSQKTQPTNKLVRCFQRTTDEDVDIDNWLFIDIDA